MISLKGREELLNAISAASERSENGSTQRKCLKCGSELEVEFTPSSYMVTCVGEGGVLVTGRGI